MNVSKGDRATIIKGPSAGAIVLVGEYIAPNAEVMVNGRQVRVDDSDFHWVESLGSPLKVDMCVLIRLAHKEIRLNKTVRTVAGQALPMADDWLRKLTDLDEEDETTEERYLENV